MNNKNFLEQVIIKSDPNIDDAGLEMMVADAEPVLQEWIMTNIVSMLSSNQASELTIITEQNRWINGKVYEYLSKQILDYEDYLEKIYKDFEDMYLKEYKHFSK